MAFLDGLRDARDWYESTWLGEKLGTGRTLLLLGYGTLAFWGGCECGQMCPDKTPGEVRRDEKEEKRDRLETEKLDICDSGEGEIKAYMVERDGKDTPYMLRFDTNRDPVLVRLVVDTERDCVRLDFGDSEDKPGVQKQARRDMGYKPGI